MLRLLFRLAGWSGLLAMAAGLSLSASAAADVVGHVYVNDDYSSSTGNYASAEYNLHPVTGKMKKKTKKLFLLPTLTGVNNDFTKRETFVYVMLMEIYYIQEELIIK